MPHTKDDAVLLTSGKSWHLPPLPNPQTQIRLIHFRPGMNDIDVSEDEEAISGDDPDTSIEDEDCSLHDEDSYADYQDISVDIEIFDLDSAPAFNAISYTWGTESVKNVIEIYDVPVHVRVNCYYALWQARRHFPESYVWLDAICIDQSDLTEKASQVAIMGDVYAQAAKVLACVGPADDYSDGVRDALTNLDAAVQNFPAEWSDAQNINLDLWRPPQDEANTVRLLEHFNGFSSRPYFSRVWIIQELFGGKDRIIILCGSYTLDWDKLTDLSNRLVQCFGRWGYSSPYRGVSDFRIQQLSALLTFHEHSNGLWGLLVAIDNFQCDDVRDRIFGTLRLVDWQRFGKVAPFPDYQISPLQLACDLIRFFDRPDLQVVQQLVKVLNLNNDSPCFGTVAFPNSRTFSTQVFGANLIRQDSKGRLSVPLETGADEAMNRSVRMAAGLSLKTDSSDDLDHALAEHGLVPIFTGDEVSVLACAETSAGDIILNGTYFDAVLRTKHDGLSFVVVGDAMVINSYGWAIRDRRSDCICWQDVQKHDYQVETIKLAIDGFSDEEAIAAVVTCLALASGEIGVLTYLKTDSPGKLRRGAILSDITMQGLHENVTIGPPKAFCARHNSAEWYRIARQAFCYTIATENPAHVYVST